MPDPLDICFRAVTLIRVRVEEGITDKCHRRVRFERPSHRKGRGAVAFHAQRERLQTAQDQES